MPYRLIIFLLLFYIPYASRAGKYVYKYDDNCNKAYQNFTSLHMEEGRKYIAAELKANPDNLMANYISDYEDCIELIMNCDNAVYKLRKPHFDERIELLNKGDKTSPWYLFCKAGVYVHWAIVNIRFGEQYKAAMNFRRSFALLEENQRLFPAFEYNHVFTGLEEATIGSLPGNYRWIASVFGMKGNIKKGAAQLAAFINTHTNTQPLYDETVLYYLFTRFYLLAEQKEVWDYLNGPGFSNNDNLLNAFVKTTIALDYHKSDAAIKTLNDASVNPDYNKYPIFNYQMGLALLTKLDTMCTAHLYQYLQQTKSDIYIKDSWQKMALAWYVNDNIPKATYCLDKVKSRGASRLDADKQAYKFAENKTWPMRAILQARLLIDGGYNERALAVLQSIDPTAIKHTADKMEYFFRLGRVYEELANAQGDKRYIQLSVENYLKTINMGRDRHEQFAARAALQMGKMYEQSGMKKEALAKYNECLGMPSHDFQNSIDQQAKAGINRVEGR